MKIKTQFISSMVIFGLMLLIIAASVIATNQQVEQLNKQEEIAKKIEREASELGYLSSDYLLYHESQKRTRWESKFSELSDDVSNLNPNSPEQQTLVKNIKANQQRLKAVFNDIASTFESTSQNQGAEADPLFQTSWSRMAIQNQGMAFDAERLAQTLRDQAHQLEQTNIMLIFVLLGIFGAYFLTNYLIVYRRALRSISDLQDGTRIIGSGNLDYYIKTSRQDEIGELSRAFNRMTGSLKGVTASKAELEREIVERKRAEEALQKAHDELELRVQERTAELARASEGIKAERQRLNDILDMLPAYLVLLSPDYHVPFANRFFRERFGESHGRRCFEYLFKRSEPCEICETYTVLKTTAPHHWEWTGPDGHNYDIFDFPFADRDGSTLIMEVGIDITERKRAEKALLESETRYRELAESINDIFFAMDNDLKYTYWNKASETITGISAKDAIGKSLFELYPDLKGTRVERLYIEALRTKQPQRFEKEFHIRGKKFTFEINAYPSKDGLSVIAQDITEKKMFEAHLLRAQRMESIGTLAGGIAHDLNNMLTPMMLSLQMLREKFKDEQSQKLITILERNSQHGANLIKQVLSFARGVEGERNPLQVAHIITEIEKVAKQTFPRNIEIRSDVQKDLFTITGDATQLHQVIMNLCVNARDAMPDGGILDITASNFFIDENYARVYTDARAGSYAVIAVSDTGTGIPPKILDRIFEPFFTTKEFGKGTGLGLSTALAIVKSHGGFINVYSEVGKGTAFRVYLPATQAGMQKGEEPQSELLTGHGELVLIVEDEDSICEITSSALEKNGYRVLTAKNGADAIELYAQNMVEIKIVLTDMMMPVMDGETSIREIRKINPRVRVIAVSGLAEKDKLAKIESTHAHAFLPKPYTAEILLKTIHEVLGMK